VDHRQYQPHPLLRDYVKSLWTAERDFRPPNDSFELFPDSTMELVFSFGSPCQIDDGQSVRDLPPCYLIGLLDKPIRLHADGVVRSVAARFFAWGFFPLFNLDMPNLPSAVHQMDGAVQQLAFQIEQAVSNDDDESAIAALHDFLLERALNAEFDQETIRTASQMLLERSGQVTVRQLADACNYSRRQLERKFNQMTGVSPKALTRKIRFERVRDHLWREPHADLSALAQEYGYSDQAHLTNEFRQFSNKTPTQFAGEMQALQHVMRDQIYVAFFQDE
jgi:AraC-like DNA-binding protein